MNVALNRLKAQSEVNRNTLGFTLAELLLTIAVSLALIGIAIPGFISILNNSRISELNNAATNIATAAQGRMTSMKTSGIWISMLDKDDDYLAQEAHQLPDTELPADRDDIFYFTADQARDNGVLPRNSIEDEIWSGDYVIEYCRSTASICGVFFSNGNGSVMSGSDLEPGMKPALDYYLAMSSPASRDQDARTAANPMVGYYWGTPAGSTDTVVLDNPVIWIDEETGYLCVQNINLRNSALDDGASGRIGSFDTSLDISISLIDASQMVISPYQFVIAGLEATRTGVGSYTVTTADRIANKAPGLERVPDGEIALEKRTATDSDIDVFSVDLNQIKTLMEVAGGDFDDLIQIAGGFVAESSIKIEARISIDEEQSAPAGIRGTIPTTATAYAKWPGNSMRLAMLVTDPNSAIVKPVHISGDYTPPSVKLTDNKGNKPTGPVPDTYHLAETYTLESTSPILIAENAEAGRQAYLGESVLSSAAVSSQAHMAATVGSYLSDATYLMHHYQIFEFWLNGAKIGYLHNNVWTWTQVGEVFASCVEAGPTAGNPTTGIRTVRVNPATLVGISETLRALGVDDSEGYSLYIRTTPDLDEVQNFVAFNSIYCFIYAQQNKNAGGDGLVSSRTTFGNTYIPRQEYESEFGAPSSVASWAFLYDTNSDVVGLEEGLRYYYAGTPAFGFPGNESLSASDNKADNTALWYFSGGWDLNPEPLAFVQDPQTINGQSDGLSPYTLVNSAYADFHLNYYQDTLFYRLLFYHTTGGSDLPGYGQQYVPHIDQFNQFIRQGQNSKFGFWRTPNAFPSIPSGTTLSCPAGADVGQGFYYGEGISALKWGRVDLFETQAKLGLAYYERYSDGSRGYYGYTDNSLTTADIHQNMDYNNTKTIIDWGYYVVVPTELVSNGAAPHYNSVALNPTGISFTNGSENSSYTCFYLPSSLQKTSNRYITASFGYNDAAASATFYLNLNFAKAVQTQQGIANVWGNRSYSYPYYVRHADHFIGCLGTSIRDSYMGSSFEQQHTIDLSNRTITYGSISFSGAYNGGNLSGHEIRGYKMGLHGTDRTSGGLFYKSNNASFSYVTLSNFSAGSTVEFNTSSMSSSAALHGKFGFIVGYALGSNFTGIVINGYMGTSTQDNYYYAGIYPQIRSGASLYIYAGGIAGYSDNSTFSNCMVTYLSYFVSKTATVNPSNYRNILGGIAGYSKASTSLLNCKVNYMRFISNSPWDSKTGSGGIGYMLGGKNMYSTYSASGYSHFGVESSASQGSNFIAVNSFIGNQDITVD